MQATNTSDDDIAKGDATPIIARSPACLVSLLPFFPSVTSHCCRQHERAPSRYLWGRWRTSCTPYSATKGKSSLASGQKRRMHCSRVFVLHASKRSRVSSQEPCHRRKRLSRSDGWFTQDEQRKGHLRAGGRSTILRGCAAWIQTPRCLLLPPRPRNRPHFYGRGYLTPEKPTVEH